MGSGSACDQVHKKQQASTKNSGSYGLYSLGPHSSTFILNGLSPTFWTETYMCKTTLNADPTGNRESILNPEPQYPHCTDAEIPLIAPMPHLPSSKTAQDLSHQRPSSARSRRAITQGALNNQKRVPRRIF